LSTTKQTKEEIVRYIDEVNERLWHIRGVHSKEFDLMELGMEVLTKAKELNYKMGIARSLLTLGMGSFIFKHDLPASLSQLDEALAIFKEMNNKKWLANTMLTLSIIHNTTGNSEAALYNALRGMDYYENKDEEDVHDRIMCYYIIGTVYKDLKKFAEAAQYYSAGIAINGIRQSAWGGRVFAGLSNVYAEQGKYDEAIEMSMQGLEILRTEKNNLGESRVLNDIGLIYKKQKNYPKALHYCFEGLKIREENQIRQFVLTSQVEIADIYYLTGDTDQAINYLKRAEAIAIELKQQSRLFKIYRDLGNIYKSLKNFEQALYHYEKLSELTGDVNSKEKESKIGVLQTELIKEKEKEIERLRNVELKNAYEMISEKNKEIMDSILYAKRIQGALLASDTMLTRNLKEYFVFYSPKDIVSGDFYWATEKDDRFYLAVCDSTGHGVPGAFMSLLNTSFLNEAINEKNIAEPHLVLNHVRQRLIENISQDGAQDGMDGILVCFDKTTNKLSYAAANNNPLSISGTELISHPADKMPVGKGESALSFTKKEISLQKGDTLFLHTDGFADQFGGEKGKKLKQKHLNALLLSVAGKDLKEQKKILEKFFTSWKGNLEQVDDVLVIGIKI
jgi:serine phosphatase RsbU (regulator of sigma subunit)